MSPIPFIPRGGVGLPVVFVPDPVELVQDGERIVFYGLDILLCQTEIGNDGPGGGRGLWPAESVGSCNRKLPGFVRPPRPTLPPPKNTGFPRIWRGRKAPPPASNDRMSPPPGAECQSHPMPPAHIGRPDCLKSCETPRSRLHRLAGRPICAGGIGCDWHSAPGRHPVVRRRRGRFSASQIQGNPVFFGGAESAPASVRQQDVALVRVPVASNATRTYWPASSCP